MILRESEDEMGGSERIRYLLATHRLGLILIVFQTKRYYNRSINISVIWYSGVTSHFCPFYALKKNKNKQELLARLLGSWALF